MDYIELSEMETLNAYDNLNQCLDELDDSSHSLEDKESLNLEVEHNPSYTACLKEETSGSSNSNFMKSKTPSDFEAQVLELINAEEGEKIHS